MADNKRNFMNQLQALDRLASEMDGYSDALGDMPKFDELDSMMSDMDIESMLNGMSDMPVIPGMAGFTMPGQPKEIGLFDTIIVHGMKGDYKLSFEETEEGLVVNMIK